MRVGVVRQGPPSPSVTSVGLHCYQESRRRSSDHSSCFTPTTRSFSEQLYRGTRWFFEEVDRVESSEKTIEIVSLYVTTPRLRSNIKRRVRRNPQYRFPVLP